MEKILNEYVSFIKNFELLLKKKYDFDKNPVLVAGTLFERAGRISEIDYRFHGTGCTFQLNGITCAYDISIFEDEIQFSLWEFSEFIKTHPNFSKNNYSSEFIENELSKLIEERKLAWLVIMGRIYKTYRVLQIIQ